jgi:hypothetical protein
VPIRSIAVVVLIGMSVACGGSGGDAKGGSSSPHGVSAGFARAVGKHRAWLDTMLAKPMTLSTRRSYAEATVQRIADLKSIAKTGADRKLLLVVALMSAKENERLGLVLLSEAGQGVDGSRIVALAAESQVCQDEMLGWLGSSDVDLASLEEGECMAEAIKEAADLGLELPPSS